MVAAAESESDTPTPRRLVIRVVLPQGSLQAPARRGLSRRALLLIVLSAAVLLSWVGVSLFMADPTSAPDTTAQAPNSESQPSASLPEPSDGARVGDVPTRPKPATRTAGTTSGEIAPRTRQTNPVDSEAPAQPDAPPTPVKEVVPEVPQSALNTIRGTVRVSVRVNIDKQGAIVGAVAEDPGPSRYFERLALEASRKWTFTPAHSEEERTALLKFHFTRGGATARANLPQ